MISLLLGIIKMFEVTSSMFYVGASDILPEPLSKEEEEYYLIMAEDGDLFARDKLIEHNLRLVVFLAKRYENTKVDLEDLVSIGTIGLIKGIKTYKMDKNIKLATYASRCIDNEILMYLRKNKKVNGEVSFDESLSFDPDGNELHLEDILGTDADIVTKGLEHEVERNMMLEEINKLSPRDKEIITLRYGLMGKKEMTQKEVADLLGISQSYISRIEKKVIKKLQNIVKVWKIREIRVYLFFSFFWKKVIKLLTNVSLTMYNVLMRCLDNIKIIYAILLESCCLNKILKKVFCSSIFSLFNV